MSIIELNQGLVIGRGLHRVCYRHPQDNDKCIKVIVHGDGSETEREIAYYRLLEKRNISWAMLPKYHGSLDTNQGKGFVFDLINNTDGTGALTLESYFYDASLLMDNEEGIYNALTHLYDYLLAENIVTMNIKAKNIIYQRHSATAGILFIVDNIGNSDFLPIASYLPLLGQAKIKRKWQRFIDKTCEEFADNPSVVGLLKR